MFSEDSAALSIREQRVECNFKNLRLEQIENCNKKRICKIF